MNQEAEIVAGFIKILSLAIPRLDALWRNAVQEQPGLPDLLSAHMRTVLGQDRRALAHFIEWWGRRGHLARHEHTKALAHTDVSDFRLCPNPLCKSLAGTHADLVKLLPVTLPYDRRMDPTRATENPPAP